MDQHNNWHEQSNHDWDQVHELVYEDDYAHFSKHLTKVNSRHHQAMDASKLPGEKEYNIPANLDVIAYAFAYEKENAQKEKVRYHYPSVVEMFRHKELPIVGCQFHPENQAKDSLCPMIINNLIAQKELI